MRRSPLRHWLSASCVVLALTGCETIKSALPTFANTPPLVCPPADVIEQASSYTNFAKGQVGDVNGARYSVNFIGHSGECALDESGVLSIDQFVIFIAKPGIALESNIQTDAPWFIVVLQHSDEGREVLAREVFSQRVSLMKNGDSASIREHFQLAIPNQTVESLRDLQIISGFKLNDAEWDFNEAYPFYFR